MVPDDPASPTKALSKAHPTPKFAAEDEHETRCEPSLQKLGQKLSHPPAKAAASTRSAAAKARTGCDPTARPAAAGERSGESSGNDGGASVSARQPVAGASAKAWR